MTDEDAYHYADENTYHNPIDGKQYVAVEGWHTHQPQGESSPARAAERVKTAGCIGKLASSAV